ncbi:hypothetical protein [Thermomonospora catenispora]|uniref:hypothetical protein n=1 Tax=Thermomonospora catenispora TaxID=2493090 RepID=UPI0019D62513|nr:hypothetical protein [Thermomonospora catenispora]
MRAVGLPEPVLASTAAWLSEKRRSFPRTQVGHVRDMSWWLVYAQARGLDATDVPTAEAKLYAAARGQAAPAATRA